MFIPRRESGKQIPYGIHLSILYFIQFVPGMLPKTPISPAETKIPKCFIVWMGGWVDGWMDGWKGCDFSPLSIFLIFKYDNEQHKPDPKMCSKVASA